MKKKIVIKLGGSSLDNPATLRELIALVREYRQQFFDVVLVHGGGPAINQALKACGIEWKFIHGQRQTTPEMMSVIERVLADEVNSSLVQSLMESGIPAVGLSGARNQILHCTQSDPELMQVGQVQQVETSAIEQAVSREDHAIPVVAPVGIGQDGMKFNVNADWAATEIAIALKAEKLIFLTDQNGILGRNQRIVSKATPRKIYQMVDEGVISGGMRTKVFAMITALNSGVGQIRVLHASAASRLLSVPNVGTLLRLDQRMRRRAGPPTPQHKKEVMHGKAS